MGDRHRWVSGVGHVVRIAAVAGRFLSLSCSWPPTTGAPSGLLPAVRAEVRGARDREGHGPPDGGRAVA